MNDFCVQFCCWLCIVYYCRLQAIFIASGPSFKSNLVVDSFEIIEVYNLMAGELYFSLAVIKTTNSVFFFLACSRKERLWLDEILSSL